MVLFMVLLMVLFMVLSTVWSVVWFIIWFVVHGSWFMVSVIIFFLKMVDYCNVRLY